MGKEDFVAFPIGLGLGNFSGVFPVQLPRVGRCLQISTHGTHGPVDSGE